MENPVAQEIDRAEWATPRPTLASHLLAGEILVDGGRDREILRVETIHRVHLAPEEGRSDHLDFPIGARPLARTPRRRPRRLHIDPAGLEDPADQALQTSWEATDLRAAGG